MDLGIVGQNRGDVLFADLSVHVVFRDLHDQREKHHDADQVRDHHKPVEGIRNIPSKRRRHDRAEQDGSNVKDLKDDRALCTEEIFPCFGAVVRPAENRGKGKEEHSDCHELFTDVSEREHRVKCACNERSVARTAGSRAGCKIVNTRSQHDERGQRANDNGICKDFKDAPHTLLDRLSDVRVRVHHNRRTKTCFVREYAALKALRHGLVNHGFEHITAHTADRRDRGKSILEDGAERGENVGVVLPYDDERTENKGDDHEGNDLFGKRRNAAQTAEDNPRGKNDDHNTDENGIERNAFKNLDVRKRADLKSALNVQNDLVDLPHRADAERSKDRKAGEQNGKDLADPLTAFFRAETVAQIVHRAARPLVLFVPTSVIDTEHVFGEVRHHSEKRRYPHPKDRTCAARADRRRDARDVTGADRCGKRRAERLEGRDRAQILRVTDDVALEERADGVLPPVPDMADLKDLCDDGEQDACADEQNQADLAPNETVYGVVHRGNTF